MESLKCLGEALVGLSPQSLPPILVEFRHRPSDRVLGRSTPFGELDYPTPVIETVSCQRVAGQVATGFQLVQEVVHGLLASARALGQYSWMLPVWSRILKDSQVSRQNVVEAGIAEVTQDLVSYDDFGSTQERTDGRQGRISRLIGHSVSPQEGLLAQGPRPRKCLIVDPSIPYLPC
jgi:hypothetical protein